MKHYPDDFKVKMVEYYLSSPKLTIQKLADEIGVGKSSLHMWITHYKQNLMPGNLLFITTQQARYDAVIKCASLSDLEIGKYCRKHGIYRIDLEKWSTEFMKQNKTNEDKLSLKNKIKELEKQLKKSEKDLAETKALLDLKKKVSLLMEKLGDD